LWPYFSGLKAPKNNALQIIISRSLGQQLNGGGAASAGSPPAVNLPVPERGLLRKDRLGGGTVADVQYFCERPGMLHQLPA